MHDQSYPKAGVTLISSNLKSVEPQNCYDVSKVASLVGAIQSVRFNRDLVF